MMSGTLSSSTPYRYLVNNDDWYTSAYGYLYNWTAAMNNQSTSAANPSGRQGICPDGWHIPSRADVYQLNSYLESNQELQCGGNSSLVAKALATVTPWNTSNVECAPGYESENNNATGFNLRPAGLYDSEGSIEFGQTGAFWTSTMTGDQIFAWLGVVKYYSGSFDIINWGKELGYSVRCVMDFPGQQPVGEVPSVNTKPVTNVQDFTAMGHGRVTSDGGSEVLSVGICWNTMPDPILGYGYNNYIDGADTNFSAFVALAI